MKYFSRNFICGDKEYSKTEKFVNAPYIRKIFNLSATANTEILICGLGFYRLFINGTEVTKGLLSPYISNPDDIVYFDKYDISPLVKEGKNCIGIMLGNGMQNALGGENWRLNVAPFVGSPKVALSLTVNGEVILEADESFKWTESPILFDDLRYGEYYDARLEIEGWNLVDFDDSLWKFCQKAPTPKGEFRLCTLPAIVPIKSIAPKKIIKAKNGYIYDFGYNSAGLCELKIKGEKGQKLTFYYGEVVINNELDLENLYNGRTNKNLAHIDIYYCKGGEERFTPSFTYHGFQYVYVEGLKENQVSKNLLTYHVYSSDFDELTEFACSNDIVNKLQAMCKNSVRSNFYHIPTDCPHREKNGWTGDVAVSAEYMLLNYGCQENLREWINNVRAAQNEAGTFPGIVPTTGYGFEWGNGPAWDQVIGIVPYYVYKYTGDVEILKENADSLFRYLKYMKTKRNENGCFAYGLGDWCEIQATRITTPLEITDTLICYNLVKKAEFIFALLNKREELLFAQNFSKEIYNNFRKEYVKDGLCIFETQTAYTLLIAYKMLTEEECENAVKRLVEIIHENNDKLRVGILGAREIFNVLTSYGYGDLALKMIVGPEYPSYGQWVLKGQTALWERFYETEKGESLKRVGGGTLTSLNHHMFGSISHWFIENILGISVNPATDDPYKIVIKPCLLKDITFASGSYERFGNKVFVSWRKEEKNIVLTVKNEGKFKIEYDFGSAKVKKAEEGKFVIE